MATRPDPSASSMCRYSHVSGGPLNLTGKRAFKDPPPLAPHAPDACGSNLPQIIVSSLSSLAVSTRSLRYHDQNNYSAGLYNWTLCFPIDVLIPLRGKHGSRLCQSRTWVEPSAGYFLTARAAHEKTSDNVPSSTTTGGSSVRVSTAETTTAPTLSLGLPSHALPSSTSSSTASTASTIPSSIYDRASTPSLATAIAAFASVFTTETQRLTTFLHLLSRRSSGNSTLAGLAGGSGPEGYVQRMRRAKATVWSERGQKEETVVGTKGSKKKKKEEGRFNTMRARVFHSSSHRPQSVSSPSYYHDPSPYHPTLPPRLSASEAGADTDDGPMRGPSMGPPAPVQRQISSGKRSGLREEISLTPIETAVTAEPSLRSASSVQSPARHSQSLRTSGEDQNYGISRQGSTVQFEEPPRPPSRTGSPTNDIQVYSHQPSRHASFSDIDSDEEGIGGWRVGGGQGRLFIANLAEGELSDSD
ncbi:hypothetical protein G7K_3346-t1 [Saitoella complicata NRRL Y-17804]|uniref:Uncharacterized protein n=1 Tax=Saitoella complicata (strain BCRC 22490 / CBS 7301 / JCM 7358 / NBRC 10748 / NRRL Y-17804) TaxID=698492 RepID=A0A0E9NHA0_SAICN|nr:hypothetical protein G7K_3346-t1 [Saitoella complicata NRRL Y-17804]